MTLRRFIDIGYAILVEMFQQHNMSLLDAMSKVDAWADPSAEVVPEAAKIDNAASMNQMMSMMAGVKGAPV